MLRFSQIENVLKWLAGILVVYVVTAFLIQIDWSEVLFATFVPSVPAGREGWAALVALLGTFFSNIVMYFIILTTAMTLHRAGITDIQSSKDAALALRPLAGDLATTLDAVGILGKRGKTTRSRCFA